jgi:hypothetical protein
MSKKNSLTPERFLYLLVLFLMVVIVIMRARWGSESGLFDYFIYYAQLLFGPVVMAILGYVGAILLLLFIAFGIGAIYSGLRHHNPHERFNLFFGLTARQWWQERLITFLKAGLPTVFVFFLGGLVMSYLNVLNADKLIDEKILGWDKFIFGDYPFLAQADYVYPSLFVELVIQSFSYLPFAFFVLFFLVLAKRRELFGKMAVTFALALIISLPLWNIFPVMSPHDRYIDNVYELAIPVDIESRLESFSPQPQIREYLDAARAQKTNNLRDYYPTSTFPSAHVEWAVLLIYFSALLNRRWLWLTIPFGIFSSIGTFFLSQHYVVDLPAGILVALVAIWIVNRLFPAEQG